MLPEEDHRLPAALCSLHAVCPTGEASVARLGPVTAHRVHHHSAPVGRVLPGGGTGWRRRLRSSEDVFGLDGSGAAHRSWADSPSDTSYFISGFGLLPPHCAVINTAVGRPVFFSLLVL